jgi:type VI secretion system lysozyme-like protein
MWDSDGLAPSLLDRLLAPEENGQGPQHTVTGAAARMQPPPAPHSIDSYGIPVEQIKKYLLRDIQALLKTTRRALHKDLEKTHPEVSRSIYSYGIRDLASFNFSSSDEDRLVDEIRQALVHFEPRLRAPRVSIAGRAVNDLALEIHIDGILDTRPAPQLIRFQAKLPALTKSIELPRRPRRSGGDPYDYYLTVLEVGNGGRDP